MASNKDDNIAGQSRNSYRKVSRIHGADYRCLWKKRESEGPPASAPPCPAPQSRRQQGEPPLTKSPRLGLVDVLA